MFLKYCFDSDTVVTLTNGMIFPGDEGAAAPAGVPAPAPVVQTCSLTFQEEWHHVRTALMDLVGEFTGAKQRFVQLFLELRPGMTAPEWAQCW